MIPYFQQLYCVLSSFSAPLHAFVLFLFPVTCHSTAVWISAANYCIYTGKSIGIPSSFLMELMCVWVRGRECKGSLSQMSERKSWIFHAKFSTETHTHTVDSQLFHYFVEKSIEFQIKWMFDFDVLLPHQQTKRSIWVARNVFDNWDMMKWIQELLCATLNPAAW